MGEAKRRAQVLGLPSGKNLVRKPKPTQEDEEEELPLGTLRPEHLSSKRLGRSGALAMMAAMSSLAGMQNMLPPDALSPQRSRKTKKR